MDYIEGAKKLISLGIAPTPGKVLDTIRHINKMVGSAKEDEKKKAEERLSILR